MKKSSLSLAMVIRPPPSSVKSTNSPGSSWMSVVPRGGRGGAEEAGVLMEVAADAHIADVSAGAGENGHAAEDGGAPIAGDIDQIDDAVVADAIAVDVDSVEGEVEEGEVDRSGAKASEAAAGLDSYAGDDGAGGLNDLDIGAG